MTPIFYTWVIYSICDQFLFAFDNYPFLLWWLGKYVYFILSSSNRKYEPFAIFQHLVMNNGMCCMSLYVLILINYRSKLIWSYSH